MNLFPSGVVTTTTNDCPRPWFMAVNPHRSSQADSYHGDSNIHLQQQQLPPHTQASQLVQSQMEQTRIPSHPHHEHQRIQVQNGQASSHLHHDQGRIPSPVQLSMPRMLNHQLEQSRVLKHSFHEQAVLAASHAQVDPPRVPSRSQHEQRIPSPAQHGLPTMPSHSIHDQPRVPSHSHLDQGRIPSPAQHELADLPTHPHHSQARMTPHSQNKVSAQHQDQLRLLNQSPHELASHVTQSLHDQTRMPISQHDQSHLRSHTPHEQPRLASHASHEQSRMQSHTPLPHDQSRLGNHTPHDQSRLSNHTPHDQSRLSNHTPHDQSRLGNHTPHDQSRLGNHTPHDQSRLSNHTPHDQSRLGNHTPHDQSRLGNQTPHDQSGLGNLTTHDQSRLGNHTPHDQSRLGTQTPHDQSRLGTQTPHDQTRLVTHAQHDQTHMRSQTPLEQSHMRSHTPHEHSHLTTSQNHSQPTQMQNHSQHEPSQIASQTQHDQVQLQNHEQTRAPSRSQPPPTQLTQSHSIQSSAMNSLTPQPDHSAFDFHETSEAFRQMARQHGLIPSTQSDYLPLTVPLSGMSQGIVSPFNKQSSGRTYLTNPAYKQTENGMLKCNFCTDMFATALQLQTHMIAHYEMAIRSLPGNPFSEPRQITESFFVKSEKTSTPLKTGEGISDSSVLDTTDTSILSSIKKSPRQIAEKKHECATCAKRFTRTDHLRRHALKAHPEIMQAAAVSNLTNAQQLGLIRNDPPQIHAKKNEGPHQCFICGKRFKRSDHLKRHMLKTHPDLLPTEMSRSLFMRFDIRAMYGEAGPPPKIPKTPKMPLVPIYTEAEKLEKRHVCVTCEKRFKRQDHLKRHVTIHSDEKPYNCILCGKGFRREHHVQRHERTHTGEKPYECVTCGKRFARIDHMKKHNKSHLFDGIRKPGQKLNFSLPLINVPVSDPICSSITTTTQQLPELPSSVLSTSHMSSSLSTICIPTTSISTNCIPTTTCI